MVSLRLLLPPGLLQGNPRGARFDGLIEEVTLVLGSSLFRRSGYSLVLIELQDKCFWLRNFLAIHSASALIEQPLHKITSLLSDKVEELKSAIRRTVRATKMRVQHSDRFSGLGEKWS